MKERNNQRSKENNRTNLKRLEKQDKCNKKENKR